MIGDATITLPERVHFHQRYIEKRLILFSFKCCRVAYDESANRYRGSSFVFVCYYQERMRDARARGRRTDFLVTNAAASTSASRAQ